MKAKKITVVEILLIVCMIFFLAVWCFWGSDSQSNQPVLKYNTIVEVKDEIISDRVWHKGVTYVIKTPNVIIGKKLTIEEGVNIKFDPNIKCNNRDSILSKKRYYNF